ncbi:MAG: hypothetical protein DMF56_19700 [Acidobacteria bacterium]|nr:MAG: hypothetical protein DMF56_19700 [Acidobacteriota bacterium]
MKATKMLGFVAVVLTAVGAFLLHWTLSSETPSNWVPVCLPYPGPNMVISDTFSVASGGRFEVQIISPADPTDRSADRDSPVQTKLRIDVSGGKGVRISKDVSSARIGGGRPDTDIFVADGLIEIPAGGDYDVVLRGLGRDELFTQRGAVVRLARTQPVGPELFYPVARWLAYFCFVCSGVVVLIMAWRRPR